MRIGRANFGLNWDIERNAIMEIALGFILFDWGIHTSPNYPSGIFFLIGVMIGLILIIESSVFLLEAIVLDAENQLKYRARPNTRKLLELYWTDERKKEAKQCYKENREYWTENKLRNFKSALKNMGVNRMPKKTKECECEEKKPTTKKKVVVKKVVKKKK